MTVPVTPVIAEDLQQEYNASKLKWTSSRIVSGAVLLTSNEHIVVKLVSTWMMATTGEFLIHRMKMKSADAALRNKVPAVLTTSSESQAPTSWSCVLCACCAIACDDGGQLGDACE